MAQEKVSKAVVQKKEDLEAEVMETQAAQIQLDKAAEDFRCGVFRQWMGGGGGEGFQVRGVFVQWRDVGG